MSSFASRPGGSTASASSSKLGSGSYVPPHLRRATANASPSSSSPSGSAGASSSMSSYDNTIFSKSRSYQPSSRTSASNPWTSPSPSSSSAQPSRSPAWSDSRDRFRTAPTPSRGMWTKYPTTSHLFNSGDSFVGAFSPALGPRDDETDPQDKEQMEQMRIAKRIRRVVIDKGKGAAAKGLNNPNSKKGQGPKVLAFGRDAFPERHDYFRDPRFFMLMYGNVDIAINYLWQLRNRPLQPASFTPEELSSLRGDEFEAFTNYVPADEDDVRARHTDNDSKGHALGPSLFVAKVAREYTAFIEREIVNGPIGQRLRDLAAESKSVHFRGDRTVGSTSRVLIAGALPPMVRDQHLYRLQAKYVDQHADTPGPPLPPARTGLSLAALTLKDRATAPPPSSPGAASTSTRSSPGRSAPLFDHDTEAEADGDAASSVTSHADEEEEEESEQAKATFESMLKQRPPICTLPTRVDMVDDFNAQLRAFCERFPDVLAYVSINEAMRQAHPDTDAPGSVKGEPVLSYYCSQAPGDGANVHPTWERTYPLWLDTLRKVGVDVDSFPQMDLTKTEAQWTASKEERLQRSKYRTIA